MERACPDAVASWRDPDGRYNDPNLEWRELIHSDPKILSGKPVVTGTWLSAEFLLGLFAAGWSEEQVLNNYPNLTRADLRAVFAYAAESAGGKRGLTLRR